MTDFKSDKYETISKNELNAAYRQLYGNTLPATLNESNRRAGAIANYTGKRVPSSGGIWFIPDEPEGFDWGWLFTKIAFIFFALLFLFGCGAAAIAFILHGPAGIGL